MVEDARTSRKPRSETVTIASGVNDPVVALSLRDEEKFSLEEMRIQYSPSGTTESTVEVFDDTEEDGSFSLDDKVDEFVLTGSDEKNPDMKWDDIEENVVIDPDGNSDAPIVVTVGGYIITG